MIKHIKIVLIIGCCMGMSTSLKAQNYRADLIKVYEKLNKSAFKLEVQMKMNHWNALTPSKTLKGVVMRKANNYYTNLAGRVTLQNPFYTIMITEKDKNIFYMPTKKSNKNVSQKEALTMMNDTSMFKNIKLIYADATGNTYEMIKPTLGMKKMQVKISNTNVLKEVRYYYEKSEETPIKEVVISYSKLVFNPSFNTNDFSEKKYFKKINGKETLTAAYKDYKLSYAGNYR